MAKHYSLFHAAVFLKFVRFNVFSKYFHTVKIQGTKSHLTGIFMRVVYVPVEILISS